MKISDGFYPFQSRSRDAFSLRIDRKRNHMIVSATENAKPEDLFLHTYLRFALHICKSGLCCHLAVFSGRIGFLDGALGTGSLNV